MGNPTKLQLSPSLLDPVACGEDLVEQASRIAELAPTLCVACEGYHIRFIATRIVSPDKGVAVDRPALIARIQPILAKAARRNGPIDVVIAGSADTGIFATCAHSAAAMEPSLLARCRFTVIDLCHSPLVLCAEFAATHGIELRTEQLELPAAGRHFAADLIVTHSFLRFLDHSSQIALLKSFDGWLKPGGRLILSETIRPRDAAHLAREKQKSRAMLGSVDEAVMSGEIRIAADVAAELRRMRDGDARYVERPGDIDSPEDLRDLVRDAGLREYSLDVITKDVRLDAHERMKRIRALGVFGQAHDP
jgi:hypothetical protein